MNFEESLFERRFRGRGNRATGDEFVLIARRAHDAIAAERGAGVNSESNQVLRYED